MSEDIHTPQPTPKTSAEMVWDTWYPRLIKAILALSGLGILAHETLIVSTDRPWLLIAGLGLCGLPIATALDKLASK